MKLTKITDSLYISKKITEKDLPFLKENGIIAIVNLVPHHNYPADGEFAYIHESFYDSRLISKRKLHNIYEFIGKQKKKGKVVVHCDLAMSRSPGVAIGQLMLDNPSWTWRRSLKYIRKIKEVYVSIFIKLSILRYIHSLRKQKSKYFKSHQTNN